MPRKIFLGSLSRAWRERCVGDQDGHRGVLGSVDPRSEKAFRQAKLLAACRLRCLDDTAFLPGVDEGAVDGLLISKDRLDLLENLTAAFRVDCGENRRDSVRPRSLGESCDVVDQDGGLVAVDVCQLSGAGDRSGERRQFSGRQKRVQTDLGERVHDLWPSQLA